MAKFILGALLKKKKVTKYRLAKLLNERYENVFRYFRPGYNPKLSLLNRIAKALKCKVRDLLKE